MIFKKHLCCLFIMWLIQYHLRLLECVVKNGKSEINQDGGVRGQGAHLHHKHIKNTSIYGTTHTEN